MRRLATICCIALAVPGAPALAAELRLSAGPATLVSAPSAYQAAPGAQGLVAICATDGGWTALWSDRIMTGVFASSERLLATRLEPGGAVREETGLRIVDDLVAPFVDAVAEPGGTRVYWAIRGETGFVLHAASVSDEGEVSQSGEIGAFATYDTQGGFAVAASGDRVAAVLGRSVMIIDGARLLRVVDLGGWGDAVSIVSTESRFVVTWLTPDQVLMRETLDLDGNVVGEPGGNGVAQPAGSHGLATDGVRALLAWAEADGLHMGVIDPATGDLARTAFLPTGWVTPKVVWEGSTYLVAWTSYEVGALLGARISADGETLNTEPLRLYEGTPGMFELAARGSEIAMLRQTGGCMRLVCETDVVATMLGPVSSGEHLVSAAARPQGEPAVASDGERFLALWREGPEILGAETDGVSREPSVPFLVGEAPGHSSAVASDGVSFAAAWIGFREPRHTIEGSVLRRKGSFFPVRLGFSQPSPGTTPTSVSIGAAPGLYLVAWPRESELEAMRVDDDGTILDAVPLALPSGNLVYMPLSIAYDGEEFVVASFSVQTDVEPSISRVESARVTRGGTARFDKTWVTTPGGTIQGVDVECGSAGVCLIVWIQQAAPGEMSWTLRGQRFRTGGELLDDSPFDLEVSDRTQTNPSVSWDGDRFVVVWSRYGGEIDPERIEARAVPADGALESGTSDVLLERDVAMQPPVTTCNARGRCLMVGSEFVDEEGFGRTWRMVRRAFGEARHRGVRR